MPSATIRVASASCASASARPSSARACPAERTPAATRRLHLHRQLQQPDRVGDLRAAAPDPAGQLLVRGAELLEQLLVGGRLLQRVELDPVDVLQQRVAQHGVVGGVPDDGRHGVQPGGAGGPQPALAHDELVADARRRTPFSRTTIGWSSPNSRTEWLSSSSASSSKTWRGCLGLGTTSSTATSRSCAPGTPTAASIGRRRAIGRAGGDRRVVVAGRAAGGGTRLTVGAAPVRPLGRRLVGRRGRGHRRRGRAGRDEGGQAAAQAAALGHRCSSWGRAHWLCCGRGRRYGQRGDRR